MNPLIIACTLAAVSDGDTLRCHTERVRIAGIESPELPGSSACRGKARTPRCDHAAGYRAQAHARQLIASATSVTIHRLGKDPWCRRTVAHVQIDGRDFGEAMIQAGHAWRVPVRARRDCR